MSTKPKAKKYRVRRSLDLSDQENTSAQNAGDDDPKPATKAELKKQQAANKSKIDAEIASIRDEGLTGRQLRMARRVAQKHGLVPLSDFDAVRQLRGRGIDPFKNANLLDVAKSQNDDNANLPQTVKKGDKARLPSTEVETLSSAASHVRQIQQDIARRRRRKMLLTLTRLAVFVGIPTFATGHYYYNIATPMYKTEAAFMIQQAQSGGGSLGGLFSGTSFATQEDSNAVQAFLQSRSALQRLDEDLSYRAHFTQDWIDPLQSLEPDDSFERMYKLFKKRVKTGYDPSEGLIRLEVIAAEPVASLEFAQALATYAEQQVDSLTQRVREDQMAGARESYETAEINVKNAQETVLRLQENLGVLDPASEISAIMGQINQFENQVRVKQLELEQLLSNPRPNSARVSGVQGDIERLENLVIELRASLTQNTQGAQSLARISAELRVAETELTSRQALLQQALQQLETARIEANRQVRYLSMPSAPVQPDAPAYPRKFEDTLVAFLIFSGIYLMVSMTASILREQISA